MVRIKQNKVHFNFFIIAGMKTNKYIKRINKISHDLIIFG